MTLYKYVTDNYEGDTIQVIVTLMYRKKNHFSIFKFM